MQSFSSFCFLVLLPLIGAVCPPLPSEVCIDQDLALRCQLKEKLEKYGEQLGGCNVFSGKQFCETNPTEMNTFCCQTFQTECGASPTTTLTPTSTSMSATSSRSNATAPDANPPKDQFCGALDEGGKAIFQLLGANNGTASRRLMSARLDGDTVEKLIQRLKERKLSVDDLGLMGSFWGLFVVPMVQEKLNLNEATTDFLDVEKKLAYLTVEASKRLQKCNGCLEPIIRIMLGDVLIPDSPDQQKPDSTQQQNPRSTQQQNPRSTDQQSIDSTDQQSIDSTDQQSIDSADQQSIDSADPQSIDSADPQNADSTDQQNADSTDQQNADSTDQQNADSTEQQNADSTDQQNADSAHEEDPFKNDPFFADVETPAADSPSKKEPMLKMTVPQFTTRLIEVVGAFGKGLGDLAPKHPANERLSFDDFMDDVKEALGGAVGPNDLGGLFDVITGLQGPLQTKMEDPKVQAEIMKSFSNIYKNDFKCGDLVIPSLPQLKARRLVASPEKEINFIPPVHSVSKCSDNPHDFLISLEATYGKMDCNDYITASGCIPKGNLLSVTELVDVCRDTWTTRCADTVFGPSTTVPEATLVEIQKILSDNGCMTETTQPPATTRVSSSAQLTTCTAVALFATVILFS